MIDEALIARYDCYFLFRLFYLFLFTNFKAR